jgi:hypothetical protein
LSYSADPIDFNMGGREGREYVIYNRKSGEWVAPAWEDGVGDESLLACLVRAYGFVP